ncbi:MAG: phosphoribosylanthranilate isomerase [Methanobacterium sp.]|jgi:phosphoribosylanthranilate isomerase
MKVKICGITRAEDVMVCEENNADLIGFINIKRSQRFVELNKINELTSKLKIKDKSVLVIEPDNLKEAELILEKTDINIVQFHSLSSDHINSLKELESINKELKIIKAVGIPERINELKKIEIEDFARVCDSLLFDYENHGKSGGTGKQIPLKLVFEAARIAKNVNDDIELFLAGGLNLKQLENEGNFIAEIFDFIDVNSGVEDQPGFKNEQKIRSIIQFSKKLNF